MKSQRGYIGLLMLLVGTGLALYLYMEYSPLGKGANDATLSEGVEAKGAAMQVQGMVDDRNAAYEREMNQQHFAVHRGLLAAAGLQE